MKPKRKMSLWILAFALIPVIWTLLLIEDWGRDFSTNYASTSPTAADPLLRPVESASPPDRVAEQITNWVAGHSRWTIESSDTQEDGTVQMHLIRSTFVFRFKDDVHITITPKPAPLGSLVTAESQSRVGKGDLGQNPRNLRELLGPLRGQ